MATTHDRVDSPPPVPVTPARHERHCCCPVCRGLGRFDRPVFGPGQVLTAADLTALQDYVRAKDRLHTRYLHGWGVVCGLEVVCDDCEGSVAIRPGYAVDPCGADIVVSEETRYDLIAAIKDCAARARAKHGDCDPWLPPPDPGCGEAESHWCIALKYKEVETAFVPGFPTARACGPLTAPAPAASKGGCGCGGGCGGGCGCGAGSQPAPASSARTAHNSCAPRRIMECFEISAIESKEECAPKFPKRGDNFPGTPQGQGQGDWLDWLIPEGTLLRNILDCAPVARFLDLTGTLGQAHGTTIAALYGQTSQQLAASGMSLASAHAAICQVRKLVMELLADDPHPVRCQLRRAAGEISLPPPDPTSVPVAYFDAAKAALNDLLAVWIQLIIDCICHAFIPQCDGDPCDDRVEIACVTVKGGKILRICNHSCRRYAGAFPSTFYWLSVVPILPLAGKLLAMACCQPDLLHRNSPLVNELAPLLDRVDPTGGLRRVVTDNGFALPRQLLSRVKARGASPLLDGLAARLDVSAATAPHAGRELAEAKGALEAAGVEVEVKEAGSGDDGALRDAMLNRPLLRRGERATVYARDGKVVAVVREDDGELAKLRRELAELRTRIEPAPKAAPKKS